MVKFPHIISFLHAFEGNDFSGSGKIRRGDGYGMGLERYVLELYLLLFIRWWPTVHSSWY